jgi:hypothetical protein
MDLEQIENFGKLTITVYVLYFSVGKFIKFYEKYYGCDDDRENDDPATQISKLNSFYDCRREGDEIDVSISNLQWSDVLNKPMTWWEAMEIGNYFGNGWRLPTRQELKMASKELGINLTTNFYWTSNEYSRDKNYAWCIGCYSYPYTYSLKASNYRVILVRNDYSFTSFNETPVMSFPRNERVIKSFPKNEEKVGVKLLSIVEKILSNKR